MAIMLGQAMPKTMCSSMMTMIGPVKAQAIHMRRRAPLHLEHLEVHAPHRRSLRSSIGKHLIAGIG